MSKKSNSISEYTKTKVDVRGERRDKLDAFRAKMALNGIKITSDEKAIHYLMDEGFRNHKIKIKKSKIENPV